MSASAGFVALVVEVNVRGWWGLATSWVDMCGLVVWLGLSGWLSGWAFENAEGWWHVPSFLGVVISVVGVAFLLVLAVLWLISENPDILDDDSKQKRQGGKSKRRQTRSSGRLTNARALMGVGLYVLLPTALVVMLLTGWYANFGTWAGSVLGDLFLAWFEQQLQ